MRTHFAFVQTSDAGGNLPFDVHTVQSKSTATHDQWHRPHRQRTFEMIWVRKGSGFHIVDQVKYPVNEDKLFFAAPGQLHHFKIDPDAEGYVISFEESFLTQAEDDFDGVPSSELFCVFYQFPSIQIGNELSVDLSEISGKLMKEASNCFWLRAEMIRRYLKLFLIHINRQFEGSVERTGQKGSYPFVRKFITLVDRNYKEMKSVAGYATRLLVSPSYLNEVVKRNSGHSASYHIRQRVVLEAKRKAMYSELNMKEIAYHLGFNNSAHFSKFFKKMRRATTFQISENRRRIIYNYKKQDYAINYSSPCSWIS